MSPGTNIRWKERKTSSSDLYTHAMTHTINIKIVMIVIIINIYN